MEAGLMLLLNLGSGAERIEGFTNVDLYDDTADIRADICELPFENDSVDEILALQVIEHVPYWQSKQMFEEMYRVLKPNGFAIVETPDIDVVCRSILEDGLLDKWIYNLVGQYYRPHDKDRYDDWDNNAASIHRNPWNYGRLEDIALPLGFKLERHVSTSQYAGYEENMSCKLTK
jgi:ubiquinone/menaquinone biosynthesis C-methylase UbiE